MSASEAELDFVVDVSSFTDSGYVGTTSYEGNPLGIAFDDEGKGVFLTGEMAARLRVRKGSTLTVVVEEDATSSSQLPVGGVGKSVRISDPKVYYAVGKEGGAVVRIRKG